ncbi:MULTISPECIES: hypothetical protein [unclassified Rhizobium]|uniref:hypothetical protein n=1 Tax=unclassified Rhizobium TaxID=2613769 RepID=UPI001C5AA37A|nr:MULTISPECIES: hypothetical protein [unclassified Rhizobium]MBZ5763808.1 hypothetical protein [Rhizobium sp. VS19-DR96]MBZ5805857.1 hypothetical protein [Rhizobium sp. VS19-DR181]MBZ5821600.1 hypothetical protein [Rhizobium sp. VS19-DR183]MBZ5845285.1 hypothetical protein [Rhizobium sp. VS19-DR104.1]QXZ82267.1 hypothetical protein J5274_27875 [Rhizobium sp. L51/94]
MTKLREVLDIYRITGRSGTMIIVQGTTDLPVNVKLAATVYRPDATNIKFKVYKDWIIYPTQSGPEAEGFFLFELENLDIPTRSLVEIVVDSEPGQNE